jgi:uncharacterized protein
MPAARKYVEFESRGATLRGWLEGGADLPEGALALLTQAIESGRADATFPAVTATPDGEGVMFADRAFDWFTRTAATRAPNWRNELLIAGFVDAAAHLSIQPRSGPRPVAAHRCSRRPTHAPGTAMTIAGQTPNVSVVEILGDHFDAYEAGFQASSEPAIEWFRKHLNA